MADLKSATKRQLGSSDLKCALNQKSHIFVFSTKIAIMKIELLALLLSPYAAETMPIL